MSSNNTPMNTMLLASACLGSSAALTFLFSREDANEAPMLMPSQEFLERLGKFRVVAGVGQLATPAPVVAPGAAAAGAGQPAVPPAAPPAGATAAGAGQAAIVVAALAAPPAAAPGGVVAGVGQPAAPPAVAPRGASAAVSGPIQATMPSPAALGGAPIAGAGLVAAPPEAAHGAAGPVPAAPPAAAHGVAGAGAGQPVAPQAAPDVPNKAQLLDGVTAERGTALHVVATHGDDMEFLKCAGIVDRRDQNLLLVPNKNGDTPLHCAVRAGKSQMVSHLIELSISGNRLLTLLRKENFLKETALHDAVRIGNEDMVARLLAADPELASYPEKGTSPLYLAVFIGQHIIARTLLDTSQGNLSYYGPGGQNALLAATLHGTEITQHILRWNNSLTTNKDRDGSTPLPFASSLHRPDGFNQLFRANPASMYQADNNGMFPIHVAAAVGAENTVRIILDRYPSSAGLRTARGRTFLHVAIEKRRHDIVSFVCKTPSLNWILNMRDDDGNTALHLAVQADRFRIFCFLYGNEEVGISLPNNNKQTPLDVCRSLAPPGMYFKWNTNYQIYKALKSFEAKHISLRQDQIEEKYSRRLKPEEKIKVAESIKDSSQILGIGSVLIATVAFGATFAVPGGFIADDHINRGTPTLAGRYTFDAFMVANALAFVCSSIATIGLMYSGSPMVNLLSREINLASSVFFMSSSVTSLSAAFALGVYMVLAPVAHGTAIVVCALSPLVVLYRNLEVLIKLLVLTRAIHLRKGLFRALMWFTNMIVSTMLVELWPFIIIFGWAAIA